MRTLSVLAVTALVICSPAGAQTPGLPVHGGNFFALGVELERLTDLAKLGTDLQAAGVNCVVAPLPTATAVVPWFWEAQRLGMKVLLKAEVSRQASALELEDREAIVRGYDYSVWTREQPGCLGFLFGPRLGSGLKSEQYTTMLLAAAAGNPQGLRAEGRWLSELQTTGDLTPGAGLLAVYVTPRETLAVPRETLAKQFREARLGARLKQGTPTDILAVFLGEGAEAEAVTESALESAASAALDGQVAGLLFLQPANEAVRRLQLAVVKKLAPRVAAYTHSTAPPPTREAVLAEEAGRPLLWRLKRYGEVTTSGLEPYVTPDGSTGYNVTGRALLNLAIPNRSAWVDARRLTRFSMRMFSAVDGQGALLALSTAGEVSYVRVPIVGGWHLYTLDLTKETWESDKVAGLKWGGSTGLVSALTFTPSPALGAQIAFDWIRLEPEATGEVQWELDKPAEVAETEGLAGATIAGGELRGQATGETVSVELALPGGRLEVKSLPFLSFQGSFPATGTARVEYWWQQAGDHASGGTGVSPAPKRGGTATFCLQKDSPAQCADLSRIGFAQGTVAGEENWGGPEGRLTRLRLILPAQPGKDWTLQWVRLGPNYDLRAVPREGE